jgi:hypothetical protein
LVELASLQVLFYLDVLRIPGWFTRLLSLSWTRSLRWLTEEVSPESYSNSLMLTVIVNAMLVFKDRSLITC